MVLSDAELLKAVLRVILVFVCVGAIGGFAMLIWKTFVNFIALAIRAVLDQTWGKCVAIALVGWIVVWIWRNG